MRGFTLRALPVCFVVFASGCFLTQEFRHTEVAPATPTHAYWQRVNAILSQKPTNSDMPSLVQLVRTQTDALRELSKDGVDPELVAAVDRLIELEEKVIERAGWVNNDPSVLRASQPMAEAFALANKHAADAKKNVKALQPALNTRHGGGFAPMK